MMGMIQDIIDGTYKRTQKQVDISNTVRTFGKYVKIGQEDSSEKTEPRLDVILLEYKIDTQLRE